MRALVTGAHGFVGRHLVDHLVARGDTVVLHDRHDGPSILHRSPLMDFVAGTAPDVAYHLAAQSDVGGSWEHPVDTFRTNAEGTLNVLDACAAAGVSRVLAVSSADVYGRVQEAELPLSEATPLRPVSPYAASKAAADFVALQAYLGRGLDVVRVRAFNHLGPGQTDRFVAPAIASRIAHNEVEERDEVPVGNLAPRRDFTDVRDVVGAYRLLVEHGTPGEAYNVCTGTDLAVQDLADTLLSMARRPMKLVVDDALTRPVDIPVLRGDNTKLVETTGWKPEIPLEQTLGDLLDDWRNRVAPAARGQVRSG